MTQQPYQDSTPRRQQPPPARAEVVRRICSPPSDPPDRSGRPAAMEAPWPPTTAKTRSPTPPDGRRPAASRRTASPVVGTPGHRRPMTPPATHAPSAAFVPRSALALPLGDLSTLSSASCNRSDSTPTEETLTLYMDTPRTDRPPAPPPEGPDAPGPAVAAAGAPFRSSPPGGEVSGPDTPRDSPALLPNAAPNTRPRRLSASATVPRAPLGRYPGPAAWPDVPDGGFYPHGYPHPYSYPPFAHPGLPTPNGAARWMYPTPQGPGYRPPAFGPADPRHPRGPYDALDELLLGDGDDVGPEIEVPVRERDLHHAVAVGVVTPAQADQLWGLLCLLHPPSQSQPQASPPDWVPNPDVAAPLSDPAVPSPGRPVRAVRPELFPRRDPHPPAPEAHPPPLAPAIPERSPRRAAPSPGPSVTPAQLPLTRRVPSTHDDIPVGPAAPYTPPPYLRLAPSDPTDVNPAANPAAAATAASSPPLAAQPSPQATASKLTARRSPSSPQGATPSDPSAPPPAAASPSDRQSPPLHPREATERRGSGDKDGATAHSAFTDADRADPTLSKRPSCGLFGNLSWSTSGSARQPSDNEEGSPRPPTPPSPALPAAAAAAQPHHHAWTEEDAVPPSVDLRQECPHCKRRFNPDVAARHIPKCGEAKALAAKPKPRAPPPKKGRRPS